MSGESATEDRLFGRYRGAAAQSRLTCQRCGDCAELRWPPLPRCPRCHGARVEWAPLRPTGEIWSHVTYHRSFDARFADLVPYTVAMVRLDDGVDMVGRVEAGIAAVGARVALAGFDERGDVPAPRWRVVGDRELPELHAWPETPKGLGLPNDKEPRDEL